MGSIKFLWLEMEWNTSRIEAELGCKGEREVLA